MYELSSVGELLSSLLGVLCCDILFSSWLLTAMLPRTLLNVCDGRRPGIEFGVWKIKIKFN